MKIRESELRRIIKEEIESMMLDELSLPFLGWGKKDKKKEAPQKSAKQTKSKLDDLKTATSVQAGLDTISKIGQENPDMEEELTVVAKNFKKDVSTAALDAAKTIGSLLKQPVAAESANKKSRLK